MSDEYTPGVGDHPTRHEKSPAPDAQKMFILLFAIVSGLMLGISIWNLSSDTTGPSTNLKVGLITCSAGMVAYLVNRFSIERGAPLAALGFSLAGFFSIAAILIVGAGMYLATFSGLVIKDIASLSVQGHGSALVEYVGERNRASLESRRAGPAIRLVAADLSGQARCEISSACISGRGGGVGPVATLLEGLAGRAETIALQFEQGEADRQQALKTINDLTAEYQELLARTDLDIWERRNRLQIVHGKIEQQADTLGEAVPVTLLVAYADELNSGTVVPGNADASRKLNQILRDHSAALEKLMGGLGGDTVSIPVFPAKPGVADTLSYMGQFASIALIVFVAELVLPLTLWVLTYLKLYWKLERQGYFKDRKPVPADPWDGNLPYEPSSNEVGHDRQGALPNGVINSSRRGPGRPPKVQ
jgi:hypothetical protein